MRNRSASRLGGIAAIFLATSLALSSAHAQELELPVPSVTIYPGEVIGESMLADRAFIARTVSRATVYDTRRDLVGKVARRTLLPGQPISINATRDAYLVAQGKTAVVVFEDGGLVISSNALALQNGGAGDVVSLRNIDSGVVIRGTVLANGSVRLGVP